MEPISPLAEAMRKAIAAERAAIVRYLKTHALLTVIEVIDAIDAGAHLRAGAIERTNPWPQSSPAKSDSESKNTTR